MKAFRMINLFSKILLMLIAIFFSLCISILAVEFWCRHTGKFDLQKYSLPAKLGENAAMRFQMADNIWLGWEHNTNYKKVKINSFGNYDKEYSLKKPPHVFRILVIGDSITEAGGYVKCLEDLLNNSKLHRTFEVWNCGVGAYDMVNYYYYLTEKAARYDPDMVIIGFCLNDFCGSSQILYIDKTNKFSSLSGPFNHLQIPINKPLFYNSYAYRYFMVNLNKLFYKNNYADPATGSKTGDWALDMFAKETKKRNIKFAAFVIPYFKNTYNANEKDGYESMLNSLKKYNVHYLDLHNFFKNRDDICWRRKVSPDDFIHPSIMGHEVIAENIYFYLMNNLNFWYE